MPSRLGSCLKDTVKLARLAQESGLFPVFEAEYGEITNVTKIRKLAPVEDYGMKLQKRYAHLFGPKADQSALIRIKAIAERNIRRFGLLGDERSEVEPMPPAVQADERADRLYNEER